jgi:hypothetical protein
MTIKNYTTAEKFEEECKLMDVRSFGVSVSGITFEGGLNNCKFMSVKNIGYITEERLKIFEAVFKKFKYHPGVFLTTGSMQRGLEILKKKYKTIYDIEVPIGYSGGKQRHAYLVNPYHKEYKAYLDKATTIEHRSNATTKPRPMTEIEREQFIEVVKKYKKPGNMYNALFGKKNKNEKQR